MTTRYIDGRTSHPHYGRWTSLMKRLPDRMLPCWRENPTEFFAYLDDVLGPCPPGHYLLGLVDPAGDYTPGNLEWVSWREWAARKRGSRA